MQFSKPSATKEHAAQIQNGVSPGNPIVDSTIPAMPQALTSRIFFLTGMFLINDTTYLRSRAPLVLPAEAAPE